MNFLNNEVVTKIIANDKYNSNVTVLRWKVNNKKIEMGNNHSSKVIRLTVDYQQQDKKHQKALFLKVPPTNSSTYEYCKKCEVYEKELLMYSKIFPEMRKIDNQFFTAKYYLSTEKDVLVLKDLTESGYRIATCSNQLDVEHALHSLKALAKFHALSVKLEKLGLLPEDAKKDKFYSASNTNDNWTTGQNTHLRAFLGQLHPSERIKYNRKLSQLNARFWDRVLEDMKPDPNAFSVLNHGDFCMDNLMFKYDRYENVRKVKILDFQLCRWGSPAIDILYFFITSVKFEVFEKYFDLLLKIYVDTLNKALKVLECETCDIAELRRDIDRKVAFPYYVYTSVLGVLLANPSERFDMEKFIETEDNADWESRVWRNQGFVSKALRWFRYYAQKGVFDDEIDTLRSSISSEFLEHFQKDNLRRVTDYNLQENIIAEGNNFLSGISRLTVTYQQNQQTRTTSVLFKIPSEGVLYEQLKNVIEYRNEIIMYNSVLPAMYAFWKDEERFTAESYLPPVSNNLVLEDLTASGYTVVEKKKQMDLSHSVAALRQLAKFHALSAKLLDVAPEKVTLMQALKRDNVGPEIQKQTDLVFGKFCRTVEHVTKDQECCRKLEQFRKRHYGRVYDRVFGPFDGFNVLCHGDFHLNNVLFKHDPSDSGLIEGVKLIDFQIPRRGSPVTDLWYFFVTSVQVDVFLQHEEYLLQEYLSTLQRVTESLGCECSYTRQNLSEDLEYFKHYVMNILVSTLPVILGDRNFLQENERDSSIYETPALQRSLSKWMEYVQRKNII